MIAKREIQHTRIYQEFNDTDREYWFDFKKNKFLHNIDTFYYSVKLLEDFTDDSKDDSVLKLRQFFDKKKSLLASRHGESVPVYFPAAIVLSTCVLGLLLAFSIYVWKIRNGSIYLLAPVVPHGSDGGLSVTCEIVVQIRSYMLWMYGVHESFERSYHFVEQICDFFGLHVAYCQENRILRNPALLFLQNSFLYDCCQ